MNEKIRNEENHDKGIKKRNETGKEKEYMTKEYKQSREWVIKKV